MIRRFARAYRKANTEHPQRMDYAGAVVAYVVTLVIELATLDLEPWWMVLGPLAPAIAYVSMRRSIREDQNRK